MRRLLPLAFVPPAGAGEPPRSHSAWRPARRSWRVLRRGPGVTGGRALRRFSGPRAAACCGRCCRTDATAAPVLTGMKKINAPIRKPVQEKCTDFPAISCVLYRCPPPIYGRINLCEIEKKPAKAGFYLYLILIVGKIRISTCDFCGFWTLSQMGKADKIRTFAKKNNKTPCKQKSKMLF